MIVLYISTVLFTSLYQDLPLSQDYFSRLDSTFVTLFQIMTLDGWSDIAREVLEHRPESFVLFAIFVIFSSFFVINLVVGVICETLIDRDRTEKEARKEELLHERERNWGLGTLPADWYKKIPSFFSLGFSREGRKAIYQEKDENRQSRESKRLSMQMRRMTLDGKQSMPYFSSSSRSTVTAPPTAAASTFRPVVSPPTTHDTSTLSKDDMLRSAANQAIFEQLLRTQLEMQRQIETLTLEVKMLRKEHRFRHRRQGGKESETPSDLLYPDETGSADTPNNRSYRNTRPHHQESQYRSDKQKERHESEVELSKDSPRDSFMKLKGGDDTEPLQSDRKQAPLSRQASSSELLDTCSQTSAKRTQLRKSNRRKATGGTQLPTAKTLSSSTATIRSTTKAITASTIE